MLNIDNFSEETSKITNPNQQKILERERRNKRKSKIFHNIDDVNTSKKKFNFLNNLIFQDENHEDNNNNEEIIINSDIKRRVLIEEIRNKIHLNNNVESSLNTFIANGQVENEYFSLNKFITEIGTIEKDSEIHEIDLKNESSDKDKEKTVRKFGTKIKHSERLIDGEE